jgi:hypothetical protein
MRRVTDLVWQQRVSSVSAACQQRGVRCRWCDAKAVHMSCRDLRLFNNQLTGSIPSTLGNVTTLT